MTVKQKIIKKIEAIDDQQFLKELMQLIDAAHDLQVPDTFSENEKLSVQEGYEEYQGGNTFSDEDAKKIIRQWFKER